MRGAQKWHNRPQHERADIRIGRTAMCDEIQDGFCAECIDRAAAGVQHVRALATTASVAVGLPMSDFLRISAVYAARDKSSPICAL